MGRIFTYLGSEATVARGQGVRDEESSRVLSLTNRVD